MNNDKAVIDGLLQELDVLGLKCRGGFLVTADDAVPDIDSEGEHLMLLFGHAGGSIWPTFAGSAEYADGQPDPMNRWSQRVATELVNRYGAHAFFPFGGPPYLPFLKWAKKAENLQSSKLGMLIHPRYGLWHAYRFALVLRIDADSKGVFSRMLDQWTNHAETCSDTHLDICEQCETQPCLNMCPVAAFDGTSYDVKACVHYLSRTPDAACHTQGCQARVVCPVGQDYFYPADQASFHISQFIKTQSRVFGDGGDRE